MGLNIKCPKHGSAHPDYLCPDPSKKYKYGLDGGIKEDNILCPRCGAHLKTREEESHEKHADYPTLEEQWADWEDRIRT